MTTLILAPKLSQDSLLLERSAASLGWSVTRTLRPPDDVTQATVYGEIAFCDVIADALGLSLLETPDDWLPNLPHSCLGRRVQLIKHHELRGVRSRQFFKPANDKVFHAGVYANGAYVPYRQIDPNAPVLVSDVVTFEAEVRCYILDRTVITASIYKGLEWETTAEFEDKILQEALVWMQQFLANPEVQLPSAIVVDVGFIPEWGWAVVEANQAYASGVYAGGYNSRESKGADPQKVLLTVERSASSQVSEEDRRWLRPTRPPQEGTVYSRRNPALPENRR